MSIYKSPFLEPYTRRLSRHSCPRCKQDKSFTLYIDGNTNRPIHRSVGRCNRENSCAYHYKHREYFRDNPDNGLAYKLRNNPLQGKYTSANEKNCIFSPNFNIDNTKKETLEEMVEIKMGQQNLMDGLGFVVCEYE